MTDQSVIKVIVHTNLKNLIPWGRSKSDGSASKDGELFWSTRVTKNSKSQNPNNKQITMTEIQNSKRLHHLKKREFQICLGH